MGKSLRADIIIGGKADNSFYRLGNTLEQLGSQVSIISDKLLDFGKESVEAYVGYEDAMLDAQVALRTQYESASELGQVMEALDKSALQWASDSRFTTEDVAGAISNAAHAGWDLEQILKGVPAAMDISLAGSMGLAEGLEYLVDISNAAGIGFDDLGEMVDYWAYAANKSSTTIPEMGQAMQKMGATMQFVKGDMAGLTTMLAVLANNGAKGTEAGTLLRNSMIRLIAPTKSAADAMDMLELSAEELEEIYADSGGMEEAAKLLEEAGFSAYNAKGDLKSFLDIFQELNAATSTMTEQDRNKVLSAIFPTRTITGALALLDAAANGWDGLYDSIQRNGSGYAEYAAETMESGLGGVLRHLESVYDALETKTGGALEESISNIATDLAGLIDAINQMDDKTFGAIVNGLEVIAVAGPGLMTAGGALKLLGAVAAAGTGGQLLLLGTGLAAIGVGLHSISEANYEEKFGQLKLGTEDISEALSTLGQDFQTAQESIEGYNDAVSTALDNYTNASGSLKEGLLTQMLTAAELTESDKERLYGLGDEMRSAIFAGIDGSYSSAEETVALLGNGDAVALAADEGSLWADVMDTLNYGYQGAITQAEALSQQLREAMTSAFTDGALTAEEIDNIQKIISAQNEMLSIQTEAQNAVEVQKILRRAQTLGLDGLEEISELVTNQRDSELDSLEENYWQAYYQTQLGGQMKIRDGVAKGDGTKYTQEDLDRELEALEYGDREDPTDGYVGRRMASNAKYDKMLLDLYETTAAESELAGVWEGLASFADRYLETGVMTQSALRQYQNDFGLNDRNSIARYLEEMTEAFGGTEEILSRADYYAQTAEEETANAFSKLAAMYALAGAGSISGADTLGIETAEGFGGYRQEEFDIQAARKRSQILAEQDAMTEAAWNAMEEAMDTGLAWNFRDMMSGNYTDTGYQAGIRSIVNELGKVYDLSAVQIPKGLESVRDYAAAWRLLFDESIQAEDYRIQVTPELTRGGLEQLENIAIDILPRQADMGLEALESQGVTVDVTGDTTTLQATIEAEDGKTLLEYIDGDAEGLTAAIYAEDGKTLLENVDGDISALSAAIEAYNGKTITVNVAYRSAGGTVGAMRLFAEGGRAEEASIFGEAGPEWAIPEEHSQRTAELLDAARQASGFTWPELLTRNGGLNAGRGGDYTLVYSPTIVARDATDVEQKLKEDKKRLEKWLRDRQLHDNIEVYA